MSLFRCLHESLIHKVLFLFSVPCENTTLTRTIISLQYSTYNLDNSNPIYIDHIFRCLEFMPDYINCLLQGYGVLPGPPSKVHVTNVAPYFAILHWSSPTTLGDTVQYYNLHYRKITSDDNQYSIIQKVC